jgi:signal transduction histidine kinase
LTEIANNVPGVVYQFVRRADGSHGYSFVGSRSLEVFGIGNDPESFEAQFLSAIHPDDLPGFALAGEQAIANPAPWQFEGRFRKPSEAAAGDGWRWFRAECRPTRRHGETVFSGVLSDVTARREAEIQIQDMTRQLASVNAELEKRVTERTRELEATAVRLQQIIDTIDSALLVWSGQRKLILWNQAFLRMFPATAPLLQIDLEREALAAIMRTTGDIIPADHPAAQWDALGTHEVALPNGRIIEINRLRTADDGRLIMHTDVTELRRNRQIIARNERLAALGSLVAGVAHEINTPLGNALMVSTTLADHLREFDHARDDGPLKRSTFDQFIARVHESNDHLLRNLRRAADLILHFKQVAVDQTSDRRRRFELGTVLEDVLATVSSRVRKAGHTIEARCPPGIRMDSYPGAIGQIVTNLVENALIHAFDNRQNGHIVICASALSDHEAEITVSDDGNGIPSQDIGRIFDPFFTTRLGSGGSGLGLSIVLNLVRDALGGDIGVESAPAQGTRFVIRIPATAPARKSQAAEHP